MPTTPHCSACISGLPHHCTSYTYTADPRLIRFASSLQRSPNPQHRSQSASARLIRPAIQTPYEPPTPRLIQDLPWAPLSRRAPPRRRIPSHHSLLRSPRISHAAPRHSVGDARRDLPRAPRREEHYLSRNRLTQPTSRLHARSPAARVIPSTNYHFESDWRADEQSDQDIRHGSPANKRRRLELPRLRTQQFSGREVQGGIPYVEVRGYASDRTSETCEEKCVPGRGIYCGKRV